MSYKNVIQIGSAQGGSTSYGKISRRRSIPRYEIPRRPVISGSKESKNLRTKSLAQKGN
jgi:hypothetical protein